MLTVIVITILAIPLNSFCTSDYENIKTETELGISSSDFLQRNDLQIINKDMVPEGITPIIFKSEEEAMEFLKELDDDYNNNFSYNERDIEIPSNFNTYDVNDYTPYREQMVEKVHKQVIFNLSSVGGKIISEVSYDVSSWNYDEVLYVNYMDVYTNGAYGFQEVVINNEQATNRRSYIDCNVRGYSKVYIGISGGGASGNIVLKTYHFDESYKIYP